VQLNLADNRKGVNMNKLFVNAMGSLLLLSACATNQETRFNYKIGEPKVQIVETIPENISDYIWIEDFNILTVPSPTHGLHHVAAKSVLKLADDKNGNLAVIKSSEVVPDSSVFWLGQRQQIRGALFRKKSPIKP
jgi:hypothetical protein